VLIALAIIGGVSFLVMLPHHIRCFSEFWWGIDALPDGAVKNEAVARDAVDIVVLAFQFVLMVCAVPVLSYRRVASKAFTSESLVIEDGLLRWTRHDTSLADDSCLFVTVCRVDACSFSYDGKHRTLDISALEDGAIARGLFVSAAAASSADMATLDHIDKTSLYPYFSPDLIQYLRDLGVEVA